MVKKLTWISGSLLLMFVLASCDDWSEALQKEQIRFADEGGSGDGRNRDDPHRPGTMDALFINDNEVNLNKVLLAPSGSRVNYFIVEGDRETSLGEARSANDVVAYRLDEGSSKLFRAEVLHNGKSVIRFFKLTRIPKSPPTNNGDEQGKPPGKGEHQDPSHGERPAPPGHNPPGGNKPPHHGEKPSPPSHNPPGGDNPPHQGEKPSTPSHNPPANEGPAPQPPEQPSTEQPEAPPQQEADSTPPRVTLESVIFTRAGEEVLPGSEDDDEDMDYFLQRDDEIEITVLVTDESSQALDVKLPPQGSAVTLPIYLLEANEADTKFGDPEEPEFNEKARLSSWTQDNGELRLTFSFTIRKEYNHLTLWSTPISLAQGLHLRDAAGNDAGELEPKDGEFPLHWSLDM